MCTGSRDQTVGNPLCSKFCCMYSIKQNQLIMGALPLADVTVHYIDIRAVGKGYDEFFEQAKAMGANFVKGRVASIVETDDGRPDPPLRGHRQRRHDRRGRVRPRRARGRRPAEPRRRAPLQGRGARARRLRLRRRGRRGREPRAARASPASSSPAPPPARATSPSRSSTPVPRWRRPPPISSGRRCRHERAAHRRLRLPLRRQHLRLRRRRAASSTPIKDEPGVVVARRAMFTCSDATQQEIVDDIQEQRARRPRRRLLLAEAAHVHVPRGRRAAPA